MQRGRMPGSLHVEGGQTRSRRVGFSGSMVAAKGVVEGLLVQGRGTATDCCGTIGASVGGMFVLFLSKL